MILIDGEERDHKEQPYSERQYVLIRKHLMKGSSAENLQNQVRKTNKAETCRLCRGGIGL